MTFVKEPCNCLYWKYNAHVETVCTIAHCTMHIGESACVRIRDICAIKMSNYAFHRQYQSCKIQICKASPLWKVIKHVVFYCDMRSCKYSLIKGHHKEIFSTVFHVPQPGGQLIFMPNIPFFFFFFFKL